MGEFAHWCPVHREAHVDKRDAGMREGVRDDEERVHCRARERDTDAQRAFRLARPVRRVVPCPLEDLTDIDKVSGPNSTGTTGVALVPQVCGCVCGLDTCNTVSEVIVDRAVYGGGICAKEGREEGREGNAPDC